MPAIWTTPITWNVDQLVTNSDLNEQVRDNLEYLLSPNHQRIMHNNGGDYSITSVTTFQDIDSTDLSISLVTHGGPVLVHFQAVAYTSGLSHEGCFDLTVNGTRLGTSYLFGLARIRTDSSGRATVSMLVLLTGLSAGTCVLRPQWRSDTGDTVTLQSDPNTHPIIFEAIEL